MRMLEGTFNAKLRKALAEHPALSDWCVIKQFNPYHKGIPDFLVQREQRAICFEVKMFPEEPTKIQRYYLNKMNGFWIQASRDGRKACIFPFLAGDVVLNGRVELVEEIVRRCINA